MPKTTLELMNHCSGVGKRKRRLVEENTSLYMVDSERERNDRCFEDQKINIQKIKMKCISLLFFGVNKSW